jgi:hypothetical protein
MTAPIKATQLPINKLSINERCRIRQSLFNHNIDSGFIYARYPTGIRKVKKITKNMMYKLLEKSKFPNQIRFVRNSIYKMYGELEYKPIIDQKEILYNMAKKRGITTPHFYFLNFDYKSRCKNRGLHKIRYYRYLGNGDIAKGYDKYLDISNNMADKIYDLILEFDDKHMDIARYLLKNNAPYNQVVSVGQMIKTSHIVPEHGYKPKKFKRLRKLLKGKL